MNKKELHLVSVISLVNDLLCQGMKVRIRATGRSMRPYLMGDELLTLDKVSDEHLAIGDLVLFNTSAHKVIMHRIIAKQKVADHVVYITRGDGLRQADEPVLSSQIIAKVVKVECPPELLTFSFKRPEFNLSGDVLSVNAAQRNLRLVIPKVKRMIKSRLSDFNLSF